MNTPPTPPLASPLIRVALVEDHTLLRETMKRILNSVADIKVVGEATTRAEGLAMLRKTRPDVLVQDVCLGDDDGIEMLQEIKLIVPGIRCLVLTGYNDDGLILQAVRHSADGFLRKSCSMPTLVQAIRQLAKGQRAWDPDALARLARFQRNLGEEGADTGVDSLAPLEFRIAKFISEGMTNRQIGTHLNLAEKTIRNRVSLIMDKLQVSRRARIAALFIQHLEWPDKKKCLNLKPLSPRVKATSSIPIG